MRTIKIIEHISLDGVVQAPGGPGEDCSGNFGHGGWAFPHFDPAIGEAIEAAQGVDFDLLLGRRTYDIFASYWPQQEGPMADQLNGSRKYVATHRPQSLEWGPAEDLGADVASGIGRIKASPGKNLVVWGSSTLTPLLIAQGLADEVLLMVFPVLLGTGKRLFSDTVAPSELTLINTTAAPSGVIISTYKPAGALRTGSFANDPG